jgi:hypothetical protein
MDYYSIAIETLAFLYEILKLYNLKHIYSHIIRILNLPKIAKIDSIRLAILHLTLYLYILIS